MCKLLSHVKDVSVHSFELALGFLLIFARILVVPQECASISRAWREKRSAYFQSEKVVWSSKKTSMTAIIHTISYHYNNDMK